MAYTVKELNDDTMQILDSSRDGIYLIKGRDRAVLFDTGMDTDLLKPLVDKYIATPYDVVFSHAHGDHTGRSGEFDGGFMSQNDIEMYRYSTESFQKRNAAPLCFLPVEKLKPLSEYIDLGERKLQVIECFGHTPGSVILVDKKNKSVFTGDAIGSGCGVWMQVDGALSVRRYALNLISAYTKLQDIGVNDEWSFYGGHPGQEYQSRVSSYNPLCMALIQDMITLCAKLVHGSQDYEDSTATEFSTGKPKYTSYGRAEMIFTAENIDDRR